jgi:hypothetical protein
VLRLKTPYSDGTSHLLFSGLEFVEKLAALVDLTGIEPATVKMPARGDTYVGSIKQL